MQWLLKQLTAAQHLGVVRGCSPRGVLRHQQQWKQDCSDVATGMCMCMCVCGEGRQSNVVEVTAVVC
jgi:hypothetical protein